MSNIYILEPPTSGKVLLKTTVGDIDIELWAKETPRACRNFIQLCLEGYYDNTTFHRIVKGFIAQGGDPRGDGTGGDSIYGEPFKDEFHQRLKFTRRGLLAMANAGKDDNGSQFFFTLGATPELQNKHTIFGKATGDTVFNMIKLEEGLIEGETPVYPHKIVKTEVLHNPFPDIEPRVKEVQQTVKKKKDKKSGVKNFKLLSFGEEAEEDEEESVKVNEKFSGKGKSTHDVLDDPKLSKQTEDLPATDTANEEDKAADSDSSDTDPEERLERIRNKLKSGGKKQSIAQPKKSHKPVDDEDYEYLSEDDALSIKKKKMEEIKKEIKTVKQEYHKNKLKKEEKKEEEKQKEEKNETLKAYEKEFNMYKEKSKALPKKGTSREDFTLQLLSKFKKKLISVKDASQEGDGEEASENANIDDDESWMSHKLHFKEDVPVLAKDANTKDDDWFEIYDPRNPLNKRRRGEQASASTKKAKR